MRAGRLRDTGRSFCCTRKYRKGRKRKKSERKSGNLLNTDLIGKSPIKIGTSETSFCNAAGGAGITSVFATLDSIHNRITGMESGFHNTTSAGPIFGILLQKSDSSGQGYSGLAFSYATMSIVYFAYIGGTFYIKIYG